MKLTFLGTGTSHGVPPLYCMRKGFSLCKKNVCNESFTDPKHNRTRSSVFLEYNNRAILIDVSPDFRQQAIREHIVTIDAVLITHIHADHIMGIPDIRSYTYSKEQPLPVYGSEETMSGIRDMFKYIFDPNTFEGGGIPVISLNTIDKPFLLFGKTIIPIPVRHGPLSGCFGFRIENLAYIPDIKEIPEEHKSLLSNLDCLIIDCLRDEPAHVTHIVLPESIQLARELKPGKCYFTHMCHNIHYQQDAHLLDSWMYFAYDGLTIQLESVAELSTQYEYIKSKRR